MAISDQVRAPQGPADKKAKAWYALPGDEVAAKLGVDLGSGLLTNTAFITDNWLQE